MCGLSAIVEFGPASGLLQSLLDMHGRIRHRGPDGEGFMLLDAAWKPVGARTLQELDGAPSSGWRAGLAFRWLQIQDPGETAAQPMASADGSTWLTFNGEIYNFHDLRRELEQLGHRFSSVSDTEVLLAAYLEWGCGCFSRLNGMWSIILIDLRERKMVISRDRFGIKPLFYHQGPGRLIVASEIKQLLAGGAPARANRHALTRFVRGLRPASPEQTFFDGIFAQPAATYAEISLTSPPEELLFRPYWHLDAAAKQETDHKVPIEVAAATLEELLSRSVSEHLVARAPLGHLISGGIDSSLLAALAAPIYRARGDRGMGASMVLEPAAKDLDESAYIDQLIEALQFRSYKAALSPDWLKANIDRITWTQEEPVAGMAVAGQFLAYETAARHGAKVVIDGQGADEFFAGYPRHQFAVLADHVRNRDLGALLSETLWLLRRDPRFFALMWRRQVAARLARAFHPGGSAADHEVLRDSAAADAAAARSRPDASLSALTRALLTDVLSFNLKSVLAVTDRNSMAHSIEARVPYVDRRIAELAFRLPDSHKVGHGRRKRILCAIGKRHLPKAIVERVDRIGFGAPIEAWLRGSFRSEVEALPVRFAHSEIVQPARLETFVKRHLAGRPADPGVLWRLYAIDVWSRVYDVAV